MGSFAFWVFGSLRNLPGSGQMSSLLLLLCGASLRNAEGSVVGWRLDDGCGVFEGRWKVARHQRVLDNFVFGRSSVFYQSFLVKSEELAQSSSLIKLVWSFDQLLIQLWTRSISDLAPLSRCTRVLSSACFPPITSFRTDVVSSNTSVSQVALSSPKWDWTPSKWAEKQGFALRCRFDFASRGSP